jgi:hypothetical protein
MILNTQLMSKTIAPVNFATLQDPEGQSLFAHGFSSLSNKHAATAARRLQHVLDTGPNHERLLDLEYVSSALGNPSVYSVDLYSPETTGTHRVEITWIDGEMIAGRVAHVDNDYFPPIPEAVVNTLSAAQSLSERDLARKLKSVRISSHDSTITVSQSPWRKGKSKNHTRPSVEAHTQPRSHIANGPETPPARRPHHRPPVVVVRESRQRPIAERIFEDIVAPLMEMGDRRRMLDTAGMPIGKEHEVLHFRFRPSEPMVTVTALEHSTVHLAASVIHSAHFPAIERAFPVHESIHPNGRTCSEPLQLTGLLGPTCYYSYALVHSFCFQHTGNLSLENDPLLGVARPRDHAQGDAIFIIYEMQRALGIPLGTGLHADVAARAKARGLAELIQDPSNMVSPAALMELTLPKGPLNAMYAHRTFSA